MDVLVWVRERASEKIIFLPHAVRQMSRPDRMIRPVDVRNAIEKGELIEDYPEDVRGHSCLLLGFSSGGIPIHVVCSPKEDYLAIITAYIPNFKEWDDGLRKRKTK